MDKHKKEALEAAGFRTGDFGDFLGLTKGEREVVELRLEISAAFRERRRDLKLTQLQVARLMKSSQSRVAKIEAGSPDVSLDLILNGYFGMGGDLKDLRRRTRPTRPSKASSPKPPQASGRGHKAKASSR